MHKIILIFSAFCLGMLVLLGPSVRMTTDPNELMGLREEFIQRVPGEPTTEWVFRYNRAWVRDDTLFYFQFDNLSNTTVRSAFIGDDIVAIDKFHWQTSYENGVSESRCFREAISRDRQPSDIPSLLRTGKINM